MKLRASAPMQGEELCRAIALYRGGLSLRLIGRELGRSERTVAYSVKCANVPARPPVSGCGMPSPLTRHEIASAIELYGAGTPLSHISAALRRCERRIREVLSTAGLLRSRRQAQDMSQQLMANPLPEKHCIGCDRDLPTAIFTKHRGRPDGLDNRCPSCRREYRQMLRRRKILESARLEPSNSASKPARRPPKPGSERSQRAAVAPQTHRVEHLRSELQPEPEPQLNEESADGFPAHLVAPRISCLLKPGPMSEMSIFGTAWRR